MGAETAGVGAFAFGIALGIACGLALGRLATPYNGRQVRQLVGDRVDLVKGEARETVAEARDRVNDFVGQAQVRGQDGIRRLRPL